MKFQLWALFGLFACPIEDTPQNVDIYQSSSVLKIQCLMLVANEKHTIVKQTHVPLTVHPKSFPTYPQLP